MTITAAGTYVVSGELTDGELVVNVTDQDKVQVVLDGATIRHSDGGTFAIDAGDEGVQAATYLRIGDAGSAAPAGLQGDAASGAPEPPMGADGQAPEPPEGWGPQPEVVA